MYAIQLTEFEIPEFIMEQDRSVARFRTKEAAQIQIDITCAFTSLKQSEFKIVSYYWVLEDHAKRPVEVTE